MPNLVNPYRFGAAWTPASLTGISCWLRADDLNAQADASAVSSWVDRIAARDFAQATGSKQPTFYKTTSAKKIGGQSAVWFDGGDLLRFAGTIGSPTSGYVIAVLKMETLPAVAANYAIWSSADEATAVRQVDRLISRPVSATVVRMLQRNNDTSDFLDGNTGLAISTDYVLEWSSTGTAYGAKVNNTVQTLTVGGGSDTGDWDGDTSDRDNMVIGARKNSAEGLFLAGGLAEIIAVNDANMSAGERTSWNAYALARYGITL